MKNKANAKDKKIDKKSKKAWKEADFEIHSLLDKDLFIRGSSCDVCCDTCGPCDPGS